MKIMQTFYEKFCLSCCDYHDAMFDWLITINSDLIFFYLDSVCMFVTNLMYDFKPF